MDITIPAGVGIVVSLIISVLKKIKGFPEELAPVINLVLSGVVFIAYLVSSGKSWKDALSQAIIAIISSYTTYKVVGKPVKEKLNNK